MVFIVVLGIAAMVLSYLGVAVIRRLAEKHRFLDIPNERSSHTHPTARGGGMAIVVVVLGGMCIYAACTTGVPWRTLGILTLGAVLIAGIGGLDDLRPLSVSVRIAAHGLAAVLAILALGYWQAISVPGVGCLPLGLFGAVLTFLWIVGLTNAYNFMDGIDGIAGGQAVVAGLGWAVIGWLDGQPMAGVSGLLIAAASLGFLGHNWPPARIFMGDVGSAFLGYAFAVLPVLASQANPLLVLAGIGLVWPFVFDATLTFCRRLCRGERVWAAHRSHLYQRLVISGLSHGRVSVIYIGLSGLGLIWAVALVQGWRRGVLGGAFVIAAAALCLWLWTCQRERTLQRPI